MIQIVKALLNCYPKLVSSPNILPNCSFDKRSKQQPQTQQPPKQQPGLQTQPKPSASGNEPIELVVTGEQDEYRVPNASTATRTDTPLRDIPASFR